MGQSTAAPGARYADRKPRKSTTSLLRPVFLHYQVLPHPPSYSPSSNRSVKSWRKSELTPSKNVRKQARCSATPAPRTKNANAAESTAQHCAKIGSRTHLLTKTSSGRGQPLSFPSPASAVWSVPGQKLPLGRLPTTSRWFAASASILVDCAGTLPRCRATRSV